ncbi:MAG: hypothetical protein PHC28_12550 [Flavobacterium sp.]|uniref:hypothetical protein n=1 Tax=Flavobacterium sp. TaxID=239 RepID=UPI00262CE0B1|nr:hypothetical protein [Flavobacterium sp.]MDD5151282.1 hypothetical protein [Flavobacterium sp.]
MSPIERDFKEIMLLVSKYGEELIRKQNAKGSSYFFISPEATYKKIAEKVVNILQK